MGKNCTRFLAIYRISVTTTIVWSELGKSLLADLSTARDKVVIVAPFITRLAFDRLMGATPETVSTEVITRWKVDEVASGVSDPSILDYKDIRKNFHVRLFPTLHAKAYLVDTHAAFIGSANATGAGLGFNRPGNTELNVRLAPIPTMLWAFVLRLNRESILATPALRKEVENAAINLRVVLRTIPQIHVEAVDAFPRRDIQAWFPTFRFPARLYDAYQSLEEVARDSRRAALNDLSWIGCSEGLSATEFHAVVREWLLAQPLVMKLDKILNRPRRFGELVDWLLRNAPENCPARQITKRQLQTLIRWLLEFAGDRYQITERRYTEILSIKV